MDNVVTVEKKVKPFDKRIHEIDFVRGFLILLVIIDHIFWNLKYYGGLWHNEAMEGFFTWYWTSTARNIIQPLALLLFCFVSGISCAFSKSNWKRAIEALVLWIIIFGGSRLLQLINNNYQIFGASSRDFCIDLNIIGVLGLSTLIYCFIQKKSWRAILAMGLTLFLFSSYIIPALKQTLCNTTGYYILERFGNQTYVLVDNEIIQGATPNFYMPLLWEPMNQADYVPLLPYAMFFMGGALLTYFVYRNKKQSIIPHKGNWERPICFLGRHSLIIYLSHMVVIMGFFSMLDFFIRG